MNWSRYSYQVDAYVVQLQLSKKLLGTGALEAKICH